MTIELFNHRGERVVRGDPSRGTYRGIANEPHDCDFCGRQIVPGEEFEEDFVMCCANCSAQMEILDA